MLATEIPHPTAPRWLTLNIAMRVGERALLAVTFLWVLALVAWPAEPHLSARCAENCTAQTTMRSLLWTFPRCGVN